VSFELAGKAKLAEFVAHHVLGDVHRNKLLSISGMTVERRDQVRRTFFSLREFICSMRVARYPSIKGPFLVERAIFISPCSQ
jgi:hypothetical protein